ncbi:MAG: hypothetical protein WA364_13945 [Candidatus Nitrosopolaris sp.]
MSEGSHRYCHLGCCTERWCSLILRCLKSTLYESNITIDACSKYSGIISSIRQQRMLKMMAIADDRSFSYDNEIELVQFIASEMQREGLDLSNEENLDSYINTKIM